jgi:pimeloyl-ACP methyl ester carboxylesterase
MQHEKAFDTGELTLSYSEGGAGAPMVLLHGLTSNKSAWLPLLPALAATHRVYAFDMRGHGKSGRAPDNHYRILDYARDVIAFLKHLGVPVVLMGQSLGGLVALVTAAQYAEGVRALVLLDPPLFGFRAAVQLEPQRMAWMGIVASVMQGSPSLDTIAERLRAALPDATDEQINGTAHYISGVAPGAAEAPLRDQIWQGSDLHESLQQLRRPTLLIHGDWDSGAVVQSEDIELFTSSCPSAQVVHLPGADHALNMQQQPDLVLQPVKAFLQNVLVENR